MHLRRRDGRSGKVRRIVLAVLRFDAQTKAIYAVSAWKWPSGRNAHRADDHHLQGAYNAPGFLARSRSPTHALPHGADNGCPLWCSRSRTNMPKPTIAALGAAPIVGSGMFDAFGRHACQASSNSPVPFSTSAIAPRRGQRPPAPHPRAGQAGRACPCSRARRSLPSVCGGRMLTFPLATPCAALAASATRTGSCRVACTY